MSAMGSRSSPKTIALQFAMRGEARPTIRALKAERIDSPKAVYPFEFYASNHASNHGGFRTIIGVAGVDPRFKVDSIGTQPATILADTIATHFKPDLLISAGTAGGFLKAGAAIGQVYLGAPHVAFHSRRIQIPGMEEMGRGNYPTADVRALARALGLQTAIVSTGDALDYSPEDAKMMEINGATVKEMEAAAIGWVCEQYRIPFFPVKAITDFVDHHADTANQFQENYAHAVESLKDALVEIYKYLESPLNDEDIWQYPHLR